MKYRGIVSTSEIPKNAVSVQPHHTETRGSKTIEFFEVWVPDDDQINPLFDVDSPPTRHQKSKINRLSQLFQARNDDEDDDD